MAAFLYQAVDPAGKRRRGVIDASNASAARQALRERALLPLSVEATDAVRSDAAKRLQAAPAGEPVRPSVPGSGSGSAPVPGFTGSLFRGGVLGPVTRQLATLIGAGIRIEEALRIVASQAATPRAASTLYNLRSAIIEGHSLAEALAMAPRDFPGYYRAAIAAGERAGRLDRVLDGLAERIEAQTKSRQSIQLALVYPALLAVVSAAIVIVLLTYVVPDIVAAFQARGAALPTLTRGLIALSTFLREYGLWLLLVLAIAGAGTVRMLRRPENRRRFDRWCLTLPLIGPLTRQQNAALFAGTLATLLRSGVALVDALGSAGAVMPNRHLAQKVGEIAERVRDGASLKSAVTDARVFPPMLVAMVASGEDSATLPDTFARAAADQQASADTMVKTLVALVEPLVLLTMGGMVMLIVMAILMPIIGLNTLAGI